MRILCAMLAGTLVMACGGATAIRVKEQPTLAPAARVAPEFAAKDHLGRAVSLQRSLETGPVVLVFYRGHW